MDNAITITFGVKTVAIEGKNVVPNRKTYLLKV